MKSPQTSFPSEVVETMRRRLLQRWELDLVDAKQRLRDRVQRELVLFEQKVTKSFDIEDDEEEPVSPSQKDKESLKELMVEQEDGLVAKKGREIVGHVKIRIRSVDNCKNETRVFFTLRVENEEMKSPVAFQEDGNFVFESAARFAVTDISGALTCSVFGTKVLRPVDKLIGRVCIPFTYFLSGKKEGTFQLLPFPRERPQAGHIRAAGTGMDRVSMNEECASISLSFEMELNEDKIWKLYFVNDRFKGMNFASSSSSSSSSSKIGAPQQVIESISHLKRNSARIGSAIEEITSTFLFMGLMYIRSWENIFLSSSCVLGIYSSVTRMPSFLIPWVVFCILATSCLVMKKTEDATHKQLVLWNDEITDDPEAGLNPVQRYTRAVSIIERISNLLDRIACFVEKIYNAMVVADEEASKGLFVICFMITAMVSIVLFLCESIGLSPAGLLAVLPLFPSALKENSIRSNRVKIMANNLWQRIPSHDDLSRFWFLEEQLCVKKGK